MEFEIVAWNEKYRDSTAECFDAAWRNAISKNPKLSFYREALDEHLDTIKQLQRKSKDEAFFIAIFQEVVVGTVQIFFDSDQAFVDNVAVHPLAQRKGVCRALLERVKQEARSRGYEFITLDTFEVNQQAVKTYFSMNMPIDRVEHHFRGERHPWYMYKVPL